MNKQLSNFKKNSQGFTLIELMVVIAIIAILAVVGVTVFQGAQQSARNSAKQADIQAIANALEAHHTNSGYVTLAGADFAGGSIPIQDQSSYPYCSEVNGSASPSLAASDITTWVGAPTSCPTGWTPLNSGGTAPAVSTSNEFWTVCALLEPVSGGKVYCKSNSQ